MDHSRLILVAAIALTLGCSSHQVANNSLPPRTFLQSELKPSTLATLSEQFLEWQKGYNIQIRDQAQGLLVTEWALDNPFDRHRITLRVSDDTNGSMLSAHVVHQLYQQGQWAEVPSTGQSEAQLLAELEKYLEKTSGLKAN